MSKKTQVEYHEAVGRRKSAVARVRLYVLNKLSSVSVNGVNIKKGEIVINKKHVKHENYLGPLTLTGNDKSFAISVVVKGGGKSGRTDAIIHGISRAIEKADKDQYRNTLKKAGFLKRDARVKERRKVGHGGKARRKKQSPKR